MARMVEMWRMQLFLGAFHDLPFLKVLMMLVLSQFTFIQVSWNKASASHKTVISRVFASTHPMSRPDVAQLGASSHAAQMPPTYSPIPHEDAASIQISGSRRGSGKSKQQAGGIASVSCHHKSWVKTAWGM